MFFRVSLIKLQKHLRKFETNSKLVGNIRTLCSCSDGISRFSQTSTRGSLALWKHEKCFLFLKLSMKTPLQIAKASYERKMTHTTSDEVSYELGSYSTLHATTCNNTSHSPSKSLHNELEIRGHAGLDRLDYSVQNIKIKVKKQKGNSSRNLYSLSFSNAKGIFIMQVRFWPQWPVNCIL